MESTGISEKVNATVRCVRQPDSLRWGACAKSDSLSLTSEICAVEGRTDSHESSDQHAWSQTHMQSTSVKDYKIESMILIKRKQAH